MYCQYKKISNFFGVEPYYLNRYVYRFAAVSTTCAFYSAKQCFSSVTKANEPGFTKPVMLYSIGISARVARLRCPILCADKEIVNILTC